MGIRQPKHELSARLESKSLDSQFRTLITQGLSCSLFEANGILDALHEVYGAFLQESASPLLPGRLSLVALDAEEPAGKPLSACRKRAITLTVHRGDEDDKLLAKQGPAGWRRARIPDLLEEALSQGALLTREDLAYRVLFVGVRTISRDLAFLRALPEPPALPLRGTIHDIGPVITHRVQIVSLALSGHCQLEICRRTRHGPEAVANYLSTFTRAARLAQKGLAPKEIAFLLQRGERLIQQYLDLYKEAGASGDSRAYFLAELLSMGGAPSAPGCSRGDGPTPPPTADAAAGGKKGGDGRRSARRGGRDHE
jgi:hypothetical protein